MADVTQILARIEQGESRAAEQLLPLVYDELRKLAAQRMAQEAPDHTLEATALVHEAYLRLVDVKRPQQFNSRGHFFAAAAEAMRRILVERARQKASLKRGGKRIRVGLSSAEPNDLAPDPDLLDLDDALKQLEQEDPRGANVVKLRFFAGLTTKQAAEALGVSVATAENDWAYAKSWLRLRLTPAHRGDTPP